MNQRIENTRKTGVRPDWLMGGNPKAIEAQEARGQQQLVASAQLPVNGDRAALEAMGIKLGPPLEDDPLFCDATLPDGWSKRATDHSMWSELVDDTGKVRASIFYKAAFYDRSAFIRIATE